MAVLTGRASDRDPQTTEQGVRYAHQPARRSPGPWARHPRPAPPPSQARPSGQPLPARLKVFGAPARAIPAARDAGIMDHDRIRPADTAAGSVDIGPKGFWGRQMSTNGALRRIKVATMAGRYRYEWATSNGVQCCRIARTAYHRRSPAGACWSWMVAAARFARTLERFSYAQTRFARCPDKPRSGVGVCNHRAGARADGTRASAAPGGRRGSFN